MAIVVTSTELEGCCGRRKKKKSNMAMAKQLGVLTAICSQLLTGIAFQEIVKVHHKCQVKEGCSFFMDKLLNCCRREILMFP